MVAREKKILIVDDEEDLRELVTITLEDSHHQIITAVDGESALEAIYKDQPDLVILDWMMPGLSGLDVIRALRQRQATANIPVVLLTGHESADDDQQSIALDVFSHLRKPFSPLELLRTVREALGR